MTPTRKTLTQRVAKLERELKAAQDQRTEWVLRAVHDALRDGLAEQATWKIDRLVVKHMADVEERLRSQLQPHMVDVKVTYKGVYEAGDEFTVRA